MVLTLGLSCVPYVLIAASLTGPLQNHLKLLAAGLKTYKIPPDYSGN